MIINDANAAKHGIFSTKDLLDHIDPDKIKFPELSLYEDVRLGMKYGDHTTIRIYRKFNNVWVSDVIGMNRAREMAYGNSYLIKAPTGTGKTFLITSVLAHCASERGMDVLVISPREALRDSMKREAIKSLDQKKLGWNMAAIRDHSRIANLDIHCMQELVSGEKKFDVFEKMKRQRYRYIVIDECQAFVTDAAFNPATESVFDFLVNANCLATRIYMSATPEIIVKHLVTADEKIFTQIMCNGEPDTRMGPFATPFQHTKEPAPYPMFGYIRERLHGELFSYLSFAADYSYLQPQFFTRKKWESLLNQLIKTDEKNKYLIFVKSRNQADEILSAIGDENADYLNAQTKKDSGRKVYDYVLEHETFPKRFLIVTNFLDVGVNLKDSDIEGVIVFHYDRINLIQMVGRIRRGNGKERASLNLFACIPEKSVLDQEKHYCQKELKGIKETDAQVRKNHIPGEIVSIPDYFYMKREKSEYKLKVNGFSRVCYEARIAEINRLLFISSCEDVDYYKAVAGIICSYFPGAKEPIWLTDDLRETSEEEMVRYFSKYLGEELDRDKVCEICDGFSDLCPQFKRNPGRNQSSTVNKILSRLGVGYEIKNLSKEGKKGTWIVKEV